MLAEQVKIKLLLIILYSFWKENSSLFGCFLQINCKKIDTETDNGYIEIQDKLIVNIAKGNYEGSDLNVIDGNNKIAMPGFIDLHVCDICCCFFISY